MSSTIESQLARIDKHDRIRITANDGASITGTFRARIVSANDASFDRNGQAIWLTTMFEHFIPLADIVDIERIEA
jgi:hypothetical protein